MTTSLGVVGVGLTAGTANAAGSADGTTAAVVATTPTGLTVHLNAATTVLGSHKVAGAETYTFDCGATPAIAPTNQATSATPSADCVYTAPGHYTTKVSVFDGSTTSVADGTDVATVDVDVLAPVHAVINGVTVGADGLTATADIAGTLVDKLTVAAATPAVASINWGDGTTDQIALDPATGKPLANPTHKYPVNNTAAVKTWPVHLSVDDKSGRASGATASDNVGSVDIAPAGAPNPQFTVQAGNAALTASVDLSTVTIGTQAQSAPANVTYTISWGDNTADTVVHGFPQSQVQTHPYVSVGPWNVKLTVDDGLASPVSVQSKILPVTVNQYAKAPIVSRGAGDDRYKTGIVVSQHHWADKANETKGRVQASSVILATGNTFPDALAGVPLAKKANGPLLLTNGTAGTVDAGVLGEIQRVLPTANTKIFILGGTSAMSQGIQDQLTALGYNVVRLAGSDRFTTALKIAQDPQAMADPAGIIVARGDNGANNDGFADALAAGPFAADLFKGGNSAIVLSNGTAFDSATKTYVTNKLVAGKINVAAIGGQAVAAMGTVSSAVFNNNYSYIKGEDRWDTSARVAAYFPANAQVGVAYGFKFADALTGGAMMASVAGPLLLTDTASTSPYTTAAITRVATTTSEVDVFGGKASVSDAVLAAIMSQVNQHVLSAF